MQIDINTIDHRAVEMTEESARQLLSNEHIVAPQTLQGSENMSFA